MAETNLQFVLLYAWTVGFLMDVPSLLYMPKDSPSLLKQVPMT
jgi:hypothetical protein